MRTVAPAAPAYSHLARMSTSIGLYEHASHDAPRLEHGYCTDDVARALVVVVREPQPSDELAELAETYLGFLEAAVAPDGRVHNRRDERAWTDVASVGDWWGRAVGALGIAAANAHDPVHRERALQAFGRAAAQRSPDVRASAFAAIGAAEILRAQTLTGADAARALLTDSIAVIPTVAHRSWPWPEPRLRYANGTLCEALVFGGQQLGNAGIVDRGLALLGFLLEEETSPAGWLSITGTAGSGPGDARPGWDQQPIEAAAIADACFRAFEITGAPRWRDGVDLAWAWFLGANDSGTPMVDLETGAGYDGLQPTGRNANRGAESTLAALSTFQHAVALGLVGPA